VAVGFVVGRRTHAFGNMSYSSSEKKAIKQFKDIVTGVTDAVAHDFMKKYKTLEPALNAYYSSTATGKGSGNFGSSSKAGDKARLNKLFDKYCGEAKQKDVMTDEKLATFFKDAGCDAEKEGTTTLALAWKLRAKSLGQFSRQEFVDGLSASNIDTIDGVKKELQSLSSSLASKNTFRDFYGWLFKFLKDDEERKVLEVDPAVEMMQIVLPPHFPLLKQFVEFLHASKQKAISHDVWMLTYEFGRDVKPDLSNYDADGAWPGLFDDFVEYVRKQKK